MVTQPMDRQLHDRPPDRWSSDGLRQSTAAIEQQDSPATESASAEALARALRQVLHPQDRDVGAGLAADLLWPHQRLGALRDRAGRSRPSIDGPGLFALARQYGGQPGLHSTRIDWILMDAALFHELDARDDDLLRYRRAAMRLYMLKFILVYVGLPLLATGLFVADGVPVPTPWLASWAVVAVLHGLGAPFRWRDLQRARRLRERYRDLYALLERRELSPDMLLSELRLSAADGVVLDQATYALVANLARSEGQTADPEPAKPLAPNTADVATG